MEGAARRRQEAQVDRVQQQLRRRADVDRRKFTRRLALDETQGETRTDPLSRQVDAPGIARVSQAVVVELTFAEPAARRGLEEHGHAAGDLHLAVAVMDRRAIACAGADADQLAVDGLRGGKIDILHPAAVGRGDLDERVLAQHGAQLGAILVRQLRDGRGIVDQTEGIALGLEIQDAGRSRIDEVSRLRQQSRGRHLGRAENLARAIQHRDRDRRSVGSQRTHHQERLAQADQARLAVIFTRPRRDDLALSKEHLGFEFPFEVVLRRRGIEHEGGLSCARGGEG
ncbi:MAG: hypothetical protein RI910_2911 [Verrucomicrobiota bacterium]